MASVNNFKISARRLALVLAVFSLLAPPAAAPEPRARPNIVIIYADDMGYGDLGIQNPDSKIPTPHLDRLARARDCVSPTLTARRPCAAPAVTCLLTGSFHWRRLDDIVRPFGQPVFRIGRFHAAPDAQCRGISTACIGKWHLGWDWAAIKNGDAKPDPKTGYAADAFDWSQALPGGLLARGFDYYFGNDVPNFPPYTWFENDRILVPPTEPWRRREHLPRGVGRRGPDRCRKDWDFYAVVPKLTERTVQWIGEQRGQEGPFFLYVPLELAPYADCAA